MPSFEAEAASPHSLTVFRAKRSLEFSAKASNILVGTPARAISLRLHANALINLDQTEDAEALLLEA